MAAHLVARSLDGRVVLDLPQPLAEAPSLVGFAELLLGLLIWEEMLGAQEGCLVGPEEKHLVAVGFGRLLDPGRPVGIAL